MTESSQAKQDLQRLVTWVGLFLLGAMLAILTALAWIKGIEGEPAGSAVLAKWIVDTAGYAAPLLLGLGLLVIGAMLFLVETELGIRRHLLGLVGAALGMAVLLGALREGSGGALGDATGGALASSFGAWLGVPFGLAALVAPLWFAWLSAMFSGGEVQAASQRGKALVEWLARPAREAGKKAESRQQSATSVDFSAETVTEDTSVSESDAPAEPQIQATGIPEESYSGSSWVRGEQSEELDTSPEIAALDSLPTSPYPEDVRLSGGIPEGAQPLQPLQSTDAEETTDRSLPDAAADGQPAQGEQASGDGPDGDLVAEAPLDEQQLGGAGAAAAFLSPEVEEAPAIEGVQPLAEQGLSEFGGPPIPPWETRDEWVAEAPTEIEPEEAPVVPEEPAGELAEELAEATPEEDEAMEPVQEPVSATEELMRALAPETAEEEQEESEEEEPEAELEELDEEEDSEEELEEAEEEEPEAEYEELEEEEDSEEELLEAEEEEPEAEYEELDEEEDSEEELEEAEEEEPEAEYEELDEEEDSEEELEDAEEEDPEAELEELDDEEESEVELAEEEELDPVSEAVEAPSSAFEPAALPFEGADDPDLQPDAVSEAEEAFDQDEELAEEPQSEAAPEATPAPVEAMAAAVPEQPASPPAVGSRELVLQAGLLFLERGRVAVSLLQRGFNLDFDEACEVLDELQEEGLIGPFIGGHAREIRMDQDEWLRHMQAE